MAVPWSAPGAAPASGAAGVDVDLTRLREDPLPPPSWDTSHAPDGPGSGTLDTLSAAAWELDLATGELAWSPGMHHLVGSVPGAVRPSMSWWVSLIVPADRARVRAGLLVVRESLRGAQERFTMVGVDGVERTVHCWTEVETAPDGTPTRMFGSAVDVSGLAPGTHRDALTGLISRAGLRGRLERSLTQAATGRAGVLLVGLDRFAVLTDACGRACGDALLVGAAGRLRALAPQGATVARLDGDVFAIAVDGEDAGPSALESLAQRVVVTARRPHVLAERSEAVTVTASVGWAFADGRDPAVQLDPEELLRRAGLALARAKRDGRDRALCYDASLAEAAAARVRTEAVLRSALDAGRLQVLYQPVVDLATGAVAGVEALGRIVDPELGPLSPALFVGVSEETGLVTRLDEWVLGRASAMVARWRPPTPDAGREVVTRPPTVAVNMSSRTLARADLTSLVRGALRLSGSEAGRLLVEITEHSLLDQGDVARDTLAGLQALGVGVGIDDFGTGWSALSYLSALDLAFMKVDRCFVSRLGTDTSADAVVRAIIDLAHAHSLSVVAEGVETEDQARRLAAMGCDHGQGWWFGRPTREADLDEAVTAWFSRAAVARFGAWGTPAGPDEADGGAGGVGQGRGEHPAGGDPVSRRLALLA